MTIEKWLTKAIQLSLMAETVRMRCFIMPSWLCVNIISGALLHHAHKGMGFYHSNLNQFLLTEEAYNANSSTSKTRWNIH